MDTKTLADLFRKTDELLWNAYKCNSEKNFEKLMSPLIFPKSGETLRVSEQEARFIFASVVEKSDFLYSIETPTVGHYTQKGSKGSRAFVDMSLWNTAKEILCHIEFKKGNISSKAKSSEPFRKDFEKLLREKPYGCWFHILEGVDNSSLNVLIDTFNRDIEKIKTTETIQNRKLTIHICVLRQQFSVTCNVDIDITPMIESIKYTVNRNELLVFEQGFWKMHNNK